MGRKVLLGMQAGILFSAVTVVPSPCGNKLVPIQKPFPSSVTGFRHCCWQASFLLSTSWMRVVFSFQQNPKSPMWRIKQPWSWRNRLHWPVRHLGTQFLPSPGELPPGISAMKRRYNPSWNRGALCWDQCSLYVPASADPECMIAACRCTWRFPSPVVRTRAALLKDQLRSWNNAVGVLLYRAISVHDNWGYAF